MDNMKYKIESVFIYWRHFIADVIMKVRLVWWLQFIWSHSMELIIRYNQYPHPVI